MNQYFGTQYSQEDLQERLAARRRSTALSRSNSMGMGILPQSQQGNGEDRVEMAQMAGGESLDDIIMQNNKEMQRRQSFSHTYGGQDYDRRSSIMEFGSRNGSLSGFQFGTPQRPQDDGMSRRESAGELDLAGYGDLNSQLNMSAQKMGFSSSMQQPGNLTLDTNGQYGGIPGDMHGMMSYAPMGMEGMPDEDPNGLNMFSPATFSQAFGGGNMDSMQNDFMMPPGVPEAMPPHRNSMSRTDADANANSDLLSMPNVNVNENDLVNSPISMNMSRNPAAFHSPVMSSVIPGPYNANTPVASIATPQLETVPKVESLGPTYSGIYSSSGFDMLGALMKVATRKNPEIDIGKVDMSCAFVVCDITQSDCPIIYVSDIFERLTGYTKFEVLGRNCRFLQSPEGKVQAGVRREFVDNDSVYYLKNRINLKKEAQRSLINYRKGGQPFMNLLTMIPISGEDSDEIKYFVGFQVDLVEKPTSVEGKNASGLYTVDYSQGMLPRYVWQPPEGGRPQDGGQTISRDDVSTVLSTINSNTESELTKRMWDKVLLENTDDVVHVLSLKGLFLYLSPSSRKVLEYDSSELVGTSLSSVCHPSDIVPVTRELKDTSTGVSVNVVFRIRRKKSGYTWFESHGSLCVEQGKGRKCIILVGRERPVYALARGDIETTGSIGENEMWTKLSTSGMFLFVSSNVRNLLDRSPDELFGTSIQALMRSESRKEFGRSLEKARTGKRVTHKHEILNKRGLVLQAQTTLYPGDAAEGEKPTFLVAQTRLLKTNSRAVAPAIGSHGNSKSQGLTGKFDHHSEDSSMSQTISPPHPGQGDVTPRSASSLPAAPITQAGGAGLPIGTQDVALASEDNIFDELKTTRCTSWQFELRQMEKSNRLLAEELAALLSNKKKRKRRKGAGHLQRDCANCHTRVTPEWRRGPSGQRDLCNSCGLRWAKQTGRVSPRNSSTRNGDGSSKHSQTSTSPIHSSPLHKEVAASTVKTTSANNKNPSLSSNPNLNASRDGQGDVAGGGKAGVPASLGGRTTQESMPIHAPSQGFRDGGERGITNIAEGNEIL